MYEYKMGSEHFRPRIHAVLPESEGPPSEFDKTIVRESNALLYDRFSSITGGVHVDVEVTFGRLPEPEGIKTLREHLGKLHDVGRSD